MNKTLVKYRTSDYRYNHYAVIPTSYLSDLLQWLRLSESAEIVSTTDNVDGVFRQSGFIIPTNWPSYRSCLECIWLSDLMVARSR